MRRYALPDNPHSFSPPAASSPARRCTPTGNIEASEPLPYTAGAPHRLSVFASYSESAFSRFHKWGQLGGSSNKRLSFVSMPHLAHTLTQTLTLVTFESFLSVLLLKAKHGEIALLDRLPHPVTFLSRVRLPEGKLPLLGEEAGRLPVEDSHDSIRVWVHKNVLPI